MKNDRDLTILVKQLKGCATFGDIQEFLDTLHILSKEGEQYISDDSFFSVLNEMEMGNNNLNDLFFGLYEDYNWHRLFVGEN